MGVLLEGEDLDRVAPFGVLCDTSLVVTRTGPSWARLTTDFVGLPLLDVFDLVRPAGIDSVDGLRRHRDSMLLLRLKPRGPRLRFQVVDVSDPAGVMLVGTPVVSSSEELDRLGLSAADFSPIDQTPDLLLLRRGQERSLADLRTLNTELQRSSSELRRANKMLTRAEARYRRALGTFTREGATYVESELLTNYYWLDRPTTIHSLGISIGAQYVLRYHKQNRIYP